jgi:serine/threonine protein kinase
VPQIPTTFPAIFGSYALLKRLSDEGERSVYLVAINGATKPWVMKTMPVKGEVALDPGSLNLETQSLCRMRSACLVKMLDCETIGEDVAVVMEHVPGKSLAAICARAESLSMLLPSELGVILAHDVFAAMEFFHDFEGGGRVHGNLSPRTILVGYSGEVKVAGYRPGFHSRSDASVQVGRDLMPFANVLFELPFRMFPQELVQLVPRLLEGSLSPAEALGTIKGFLPGHVPSANDRQKVSAWLDEIFPGERDKDAQEGEQLLAAGIKLIVQSSSEQPGLAQNLVIGDVIGEYRILKVLGEGGMGCVYEAEDLKTCKHVALKILHPKGRSSEIEERFRREAESISRIANQHVVKIERFGPCSEGKFLYLAMELLRGVSLDRAIAKEGPFDLLRALRTGSQLCQGLAAAHEAGVIHRDLKPGNIMLVREDGTPDFVKILDFGLARLDMADAVLTRAGDLIGTFAYMAPEQAQGKPATPKIDIYAVGEVLYEMLTGKLPHEGADDILARKITIAPTPITHHSPDLPETISQLVMKALARDPEARHATMAELGQDIDRIIADLSDSSLHLPRSWSKVVGIGLVASLVLAGGVAFLITNRRSQAVPGPTPREPESRPLAAQAAPDVQPVPALPIPAQPAPEVAIPAPVPSLPPPSHAQPKSGIADRRSAKRKPEVPPAEQLLRAADAAFDGGNHIEAIRLGTQALNAGGGVRAHLALANTYRNLSRYHEAMEHYRAALKLDPENAIAAAGIKVVERQLSSRP